MRVVRYVCAFAGFAWAMLSIAGPAFAEVDGPCTGTVAGVDVTRGRDTPGSAIDVQVDEPLEISGTAEGTIQDMVYTVRIAGGGVNIGNVAVRGEELRIWEGTVDLDDFSWAGVGLFEVTANVATAAGPCEGRVYICIEGRNPITTAAGAGSAAVGAGGVALLALALARGRRMGAVSSAVQGFAGGAATAAGAGVLLQQFCAVPLTLVTAAVVPAGVGVMGSVASYGVRRAGRAGTRRVIERVRPRTAPGGGGAGPAGEPTAVLDRGAREVERAGRQAAEQGREVAESIRASGGGPPGGPAPAGPARGGGPAGPAPPPPSGGMSTVPAPAAGAPPAGPTPAPPPGTPPVPPPGMPPAPAGSVAAGAAIPPAMPASPTSERTCPNCGTVNTPENRFCTNCGSEL